MELASQLSQADPIRLSLLLNYSVYQYEMATPMAGGNALECKEQAIQLAKEGIDMATEDIKNLDAQK